MSIALAELQRDFSRYVLIGDAKQMEEAVTGTQAASRKRRLDVYSQAYRLRLREVLGNDLSGLRVIAGDNEFDAICLAYIEVTPSPYYNVRWYGKSLPDFLKTSAWATQPAIVEMASLEWCMTLAFDAADDALVDAARLMAVAPQDWPNMQFRLHSSLQRLRLDWNVNEIRRAIDHEDERPELIRFDTPHEWAVWRKNLEVLHRCPEPDEAAALDALQSNGTFAEICELLCEWHAPETVAMRAATLLNRWVADEWISALRAPSQ